MHVLITGVTGMVGEGVMHLCLRDDAITQVTVLTRKPTGIKHAKLKEIVHSDFFHLEPIQNQLEHYDACFFCLGVTSIGKNEAQYVSYTYTLTMHVATILKQKSQDLVFCYVSGAGTDSTEKGRTMWARVKGKTENDLKTLGFRKVYAFRPGYIQPMPGMKHTHGFYRWVQFLYPMLKGPLHAYLGSLEELGNAMIYCAQDIHGPDILEVDDIRRMASRRLLT